MARFDTSGLDKLVDEMRRMGQASGAVAEAMVGAAVSVIRDAWKESADAHGLRDTGAMIDSIAAENIQHIGAVVSGDVYPRGKDGKGVRNAEKAFILNYGKAGFPATYWVDDADASAAPRVQETLESMWGDFLETGKVPAAPATSTAGSGITKHTK